MNSVKSKNLIKPDLNAQFREEEVEPGFGYMNCYLFTGHPSLYGHGRWTTPALASQRASETMAKVYAVKADSGSNDWVPPEDGIKRPISAFLTVIQLPVKEQ